tara:strand:+ start:997 stop:1587 length:591 start_codon:yes stop_codon:yes gene_type:complete
LCNNKNIIKPIQKTIYGGQETNNVKNINQEIKQEQEKIDTISNELESMKRNLKTNENNENNEENTFGEIRKRPKEDDIELNQQENNTFIMRLMDEETNNKKTTNNNRQILDGVTNTNMIQNEESEEDEEIEDEEEIMEEEDIKKNTVKAWENMCKGDDVKIKKKSQYEDLKLNLNSSSYLEPFNNDDFSEFGKFNC